jgi:hypothetical protein
MIGHRNSFRPKITGIILNDINGSIVSIRMRMAIVTYLFMTIWLGGVAVSGIRLLSEAFFKRQFDSTIFFILLMFAFGYALMIYGFKSESLKSKRFLDELFEGSEIIQ